MKSTISRSLLVALAVAAHAMAAAAIPPSVDIRLGGAEQIGDYRYQVREGDLLSIAATAEAGDSIFVFAFPISKDGEIDDSLGALLMFARPSATGTVSGDFPVAKGLRDRSYALVAVAFSQASGMKFSTDVRVDVLQRAESKTSK